MIEKTAGRLITEKELRAYAKCSQFFHYGGVVESDVQLQFLEMSYELLMVKILRKSSSDINLDISYAINRSVKNLDLQENYPPNVIAELKRHTIILLNEILKLFPLDTYQVIFGPWTFRQKVSRTALELSISSILLDKNSKTLHFIVFSPYKRDINRRNDPSLILKLISMHKLRSKFVSSNGNTKLHVISAKNDIQLEYSSYTNKTLTIDSTADRVKKMIQAMELDFHQPVLPCNYSCPFKQKCFFGDTDE